MPIWLLRLILFFLEIILREALEDVDWAKAKVDFQAWARRRMPGERFDDAAAFMAGVMIDLISAIMLAHPGMSLHDAAKQAKKELPMELARRCALAKVG